MARKRKSTDSSNKPLPAVASMKFWSRFKNPPPMLAFTFAEPADDVGPSLEMLTRLPTVASDQSVVYSLRISLEGAHTPVWRRILVQDMSLESLHYVIQAVMGWGDLHLHGFDVRDVRVPLVEEGAAIDESAIAISQLRAIRIKKFYYTYDFSDEWRHTIEIERVLAAPSDFTHPKCISGQGICPVEDVGGMWHWARLLEVIQNPETERDEDLDALLNRVGENYIPVPFDLEDTNASLYHAFKRRPKSKRRI